MMSRPLDLSGRRFGLLTAVRKTAIKPVRWECVCDCGRVSVVQACHLTSGHTKSCGCQRVAAGKKRMTHGGRSTAEYQIWAAMVQRCRNPKNSAYRWYGARGVRVCEEWLDFAAFLEEMGPRPSAKHTIERRDVAVGYNSQNCVWTDDKALQAFNQYPKANNTTGRTGVYLRKGGKLEARIYTPGKQISLGLFSCFDEAVRARKAAEVCRYGQEKPCDLG